VEANDPVHRRRARCATTRARPSPRSGLLVLLGLVLAACAGGDVTDVAVRPIDDVLASPIVVTPDPSGSSATLTVTTSIPLACAVIYGPDETFGSIATDADMDGGAHTDHAPVLLGLESETEYRYVLQGSDANGMLYRSEVLTFTTPPAAAVDRPGDNVATSATVTAVSSEFSAAFAAGNAIDGDAATEWSSAGDGDDAWIELELPEPTALVGVGLRSRSMADGSSVIERFQVVVDGEQVLGPFDASADGPAVTELAVTARRVRVEAVTTTGGNTGVVEIELYAEP
jgi:hypothetical protein